MDALEKDFCTINDLNLYLKKYTNCLIIEIESSLTNTARSIIPLTSFKNSTPYNVTVVFSQFNTRGTAEYSTINLNKKFINEIIRCIEYDIESYLIMNECFYANFINVSRLKQINKEFPFELNLTHLNRLVSVFIHELVHIKQHSRQDNPNDINKLDGKFRPLEYRSYLMPRKEFISTMKNLKNGIKTTREILAHASSPQEIPARAHSSVSKYIGSIIVINPLSLEPSEESVKLLNQYIYMMVPTTFDSKYQNFNKPNTKEYKIYQRYMKVVYQEIMSYKQYLTEIRNDLQLQVDSTCRSL